MNCPSCGQPMPAGTILCPSCGHESAAPSQPSPAEPPLVCPRCSHQLSQPAGYCPNCGALMDASGQWPPPLPGDVPGPIPLPRSPGSLIGGYFAGFALALFGSILAGAGLIVAAALYFVFRGSQPAFARGWGFGVLTVIAILLGLFAICTWQLTHSSYSGL